MLKSLGQRSHLLASLLPFSSTARAQASSLNPVAAGLQSMGDLFESWTRKDVTDQSGKTFLITGANAGLGFEAAKELAAHNGHVIMAGRSQERCEQAIAEIKQEVGQKAKIDFLELDLADMASIKKAAASLKGQPIHVLVNNASVAAPKGQIADKTKDGFEITMQTNHFGPFLFTQLLLENVKQAAPSRIVWQAASGESMSQIEWEDLRGMKKEDSSLMREYAQTKLENIMTAKEQNKRLQGTGVVAVACQPGVSHSAIYGKAETKGHPDVKAIDVNQKVAGMSQERGATPLIYCCVEPSLQERGGVYIGPKYFKGPINLNVGLTKEREPKNPEALDDAACERLYNETEKILQEFY